MLRQSGAAGAARLAGVGLRLVVAIVVSRLLGPLGLGLYVLALALTGGATIVACAGLDATAVRFTAHYLGRDERSEIRGLLVFSSVLTAAAGIVVGAALYLGSSQLASWLRRPELGTVARLVALTLALAALGAMARSALCGFGDVRVASVLEQVGLPLVTLLLLVAIRLGHMDSSSTGAFVVTLAQAVVGVASVVALWARCRQDRVRPIFRPAVWLRFGLAMWLERGLLFVVGSTGYILVARTGQADDVAVFGAAVRLALLVGVPLVAVTSIFGPMIARLAARDEWTRLQDLYSRLTRGLLVAGVGLGVVVCVGGRWALGGFGSGYRTGYLSLVLLAAGQVVNSATGPSGLVLVMTGHVRQRVANAALGAVGTVALSVLAVSRWRVEGAAGAVALSTSVVNVIQVRQVRRLLGLRAYARRGPIPTACDKLDDVAK